MNESHAAPLSPSPLPSDADGVPRLATRAVVDMFARKGEGSMMAPSMRKPKFD